MTNARYRARPSTGSLQFDSKLVHCFCSSFYVDLTSSVLVCEVKLGTNKHTSYVGGKKKKKIRKYKSVRSISSKLFWRKFFTPVVFELREKENTFFVQKITDVILISYK